MKRGERRRVKGDQRSKEREVRGEGEMLRRTEKEVQEGESHDEGKGVKEEEEEEQD